MRTHTQNRVNTDDGQVRTAKTKPTCKNRMCFLGKTLFTKHVNECKKEIKFLLGLDCFPF